MRSMATPNDHIDMKKSMKATPLATNPICCHIAIKSTVHPPSRQGHRFAGSDRRWIPPLLKREVHGDRHDDRHRHAVEQRRRELPLFHRIERRRVEQWDRPEHFGLFDLTVGPDHRFDDDDALHPGRPRDRRIFRLHVFNLRRGLDVAADAHRRRRRRRRRRRGGRRGGGGGGGGGGGAAATPPMTPVSRPPTTPCSTPMFLMATDSGLISWGASTGAAFGATSGGLSGVADGGGGGRKATGGGGGGAPTKAIIAGGVGSTSAAIKGMMTTAPTSTVCTRIDSGTVYHFWPPTLIEGSTTSRNRSPGTDPILLVIYRKSSES